MSTPESQPTTATPPNEISREHRAILTEAHAALKPIAERSASYDLRQLATILMRMIEAFRGDDKLTEVVPRHHV